MADNVVLNSGTGGAILATDDIAGVHYQRVKIQYGVDGSATDVSDTNPLPIDDAGGSLTVDNSTLSVVGGGTEATAMRVTLASDSTGVLSVDDNNGSLTVDGTVTANAGTNLNTSLLALESGGNLATVAGAISGSEMQVDIVAAIPAGTNVIGDVGISGSRTSGGTTLYKNIDVDETEDQVKATGGQIYWIHAINLGTAPRYLKIYNATAASVTVGTTVPDLTFPIPSQGDANGAGFTLAIPNGIAFSTAITIAATTGVADADSGAPGANEVIVNLGYA